MKKRGFTLIELLAVIVVLAIIALIATPIVMNVIKKAQQGAAERSAERYIDAVELAIATERLDEQQLEDGIYVVDENGNLCKEGKTCATPDLTVEVSGDKPNDGSLIKIQNNKVVSEGIILEFDDFTTTYQNEKINTTIISEHVKSFNDSYEIVLEGSTDGMVQVKNSNGEFVECNNLKFGFNNGISIDNYVAIKVDLSNLVFVEDTSNQVNWDTEKTYVKGDPKIAVHAAGPQLCHLTVSYDSTYFYYSDTWNEETRLVGISNDYITNIGVLKSE